MDRQTDLLGGRERRPRRGHDRRIVDSRDVDLNVIDVLQGSARAGVATVVGGHRQRIGGDAHDVGIPGVSQRSQCGVDVGDRALDRQVVGAVRTGTDRGAARERDLQQAIGDLQPSGQVAAGRVDVGDRNPADRRGRLFGNRLCAGDRVERRVVDGADVDVDAAQRLVAAAASSRVAVVVDLHRDRVGIVAVQMRCAVQVLHVAGGVQERVQVGQRTGQASAPRCRCRRR